MTIYIVFGAVALGSALAMVFQRNAVHAALFLVSNLLAVGVLFLTLGAEFLFVSQIIVYAGAIVILFLFVIMLLGVDRNEPGVFDEPGGIQRRQLVIGGIGAVVFVSGLTTVLAGKTLTQEPRAVPKTFGSAESIGGLLFSRYLLPFEVTGLLLLVATIGILMLAKRRT